MAGTLHLVATPIGNLGDVTARAVEVLRAVAFVVCEDTRHSGPWLRSLGVQAPLVSLPAFAEKERIGGILERLEAGEDGALVTDAGSPGISDPGEALVAEAVVRGIRVVPVPGPSAVIAALQVSGLPTDAFTFVGFLPVKAAARRKRLEALSERRETLIAFESPHRIDGCLTDLETLWGERPIALVRELTKTFEQTLRGTAHEVRAALTAEQRRGEFVLVLSGRTRGEVRHS